MVRMACGVLGGCVASCDQPAKALSTIARDAGIWRRAKIVARTMAVVMAAFFRCDCMVRCSLWLKGQRK